MTTRVREPGTNGARGADGVVKLRRAPVLLAVADDGPEGVLEGYASVYDVEYRIGWYLDEAIAPGAFDRSIADQNGIIPIFYMHDWDNPIGFAVVTSDAKGVKVVATLFIAENERARSVWLAAKAKALREWSIGFYPTKIELSMQEDGNDLEVVTEGDLAEASVVVRGANPATEMLDVRSRAKSPEWTAERASEAEATFWLAEPGAAEDVIESARALVLEAADAGEYETVIALASAIVAAMDTEPEPEIEQTDAPSHLLDAFDRPWARAALRAMHVTPTA